MFNESIIQNFTDKILLVTLEKIYINGHQFLLNKGHNYSINNQDYILSETNFFGKELEFTIVSDNFEMPLSIQLYKNVSGYYRIFVYNNKGMLTSVNLSLGYLDRYISLEIQLKIFSRDMTKEERERNRDMLVMELEREGIEIDKKNTVYFGKYNCTKNEFIDTTADKFLEQLIKVAIIKGHYMNNKGYNLTIL